MRPRRAEVLSYKTALESARPLRAPHMGCGQVQVRTGAGQRVPEVCLELEAPFRAVLGHARHGWPARTAPPWL
jgi:hypothetical protein